MKTKFNLLIIAMVVIVGIFIIPNNVSQADIPAKKQARLAAPAFSIAQRIKAGGSDLRLKRDGGTWNIYSVPCAVDWNGETKSRAQKTFQKRVV